jgi:hypothetical protein
LQFHLLRSDVAQGTNKPHATLPRRRTTPPPLDSALRDGIR